MDAFGRCGKCGRHVDDTAHQCPVPDGVVTGPVTAPLTDLMREEITGLRAELRDRLEKIVRILETPRGVLTATAHLEWQRSAALSVARGEGK